MLLSVFSKNNHRKIFVVVLGGSHSRNGAALQLEFPFWFAQRIEQITFGSHSSAIETYSQVGRVPPFQNIRIACQTRLCRVRHRRIAHNAYCNWHTRLLKIWLMFGSSCYNP